MKELLLLSNMYPDKAHPTKGVFVRNTEQQLISAGFDVQRIVVGNTHKANRLAKLCLYLSFIARATARLLKNDDPVYLHYVAHTSVPLILSHFFHRQTVIAHAHGGDVIPAPHDNSLTRRLKIMLSRRTLKIARSVIVPSQFLADRLVDDYDIIPDKIIIIPSGGVDSHIFHYRQRKSKGSSEYLRIGYVGRLDKGKGVDTLIRAIQSSNLPIQCTITGAGSAHNSLQALTCALDLTEKISFSGPCEHNQLGDIYRQLDFLIFPSELEESLGLVGLEAMACGTPIIGSLKGGMAEYISNDINGFAFAPGNAASLASCIAKAYNMSSEEYAAMSSNAHETSKAYDARYCAERLVQVFS